VAVKAQLGDELDASGREVERHWVLEEQPAEPSDHRTLGPRIIPLRVQDHQRERLLKRELAHFAGGEFGIDDGAPLDRAFEAGGW
jgi:hypothetical protein